MTLQITIGTLQPSKLPVFFCSWNVAERQILVIGQDCENNQILNSLSHSVNQHCKNLGVIFNQNLRSDKHINSVVQSCFHQLRNISGIRLFPSAKNLEIVMHAFITSQLDYFNSLLSASLSLSSAAYSKLLPGFWLGQRNTITSQLMWLPYTDSKILLIT